MIIAKTRILKMLFLEKVLFFLYSENIGVKSYAIKMAIQMLLIILIKN